MSHINTIAYHTGIKASNGVIHLPLMHRRSLPAGYLRRILKFPIDVLG